MPVWVPKDCITLYVLKKSCQNTDSPLGFQEGLCKVLWSQAKDYTRTHPVPPSFTFTARWAWEGGRGKSNGPPKQH